MAESIENRPTNEKSRGTHHPVVLGDLRSPCPMLNCLANRGYLPRDGQDIQVEDLLSAMELLNISSPLRSILSRTPFLEHYDVHDPPKRSILDNIWYYVTNPSALLLSSFGVRQPGRINTEGKQIISLADFQLHNTIEHDVSISRRDFAQGDNTTPQPDLIEALLGASSDGEFLTIEDLSRFRKYRIRTQQKENKELDLSTKAKELGAGEIALMLKVLGDGQKVRVDFLRAFFLDERLPVEEGWKKREGPPVGLLELVMHARKVKALVAADN